MEYIMNKDGIKEVVFLAIEELNAELPEEQRLGKYEDTILFGNGGKLDSLGLVNLIVAIEQGMADQFDMELTLADEKAMSQKVSPFQSVGVLVDYIDQRLKENTDD
jgi:acyl carrier protein